MLLSPIITGLLRCYSRVMFPLCPPCQDMDLKRTVEDSARIRRCYGHYFDLCIVNDNLDQAYEKLQAAVDKLCTEPQWVPVNWVY